MTGFLAGLIAAFVAVWAAALVVAAPPGTSVFGSFKDVTQNFGASDAGRLAVAIVAAGVALLVAIVLVVGRIRRGPELIQLPSPDGTEFRPGGGLAVRRESLCAIVTLITEELDGVHALRAKVRLRRRMGDWRVDLAIAVNRDVSLRHVVERLEHKLDETLAFHTGIGVGVVNVRAELDPHRRRDLVRAL